MNIKINDKWKYGAIPGLLIHSCLGTVYCWSLFGDYLRDSMGGMSCDWAFSLAIFLLGISAAFLGPLVEKNVKMSALMSAIFFGSGMIISGIACALGNVLMFHLGYGVIMGIGLGIGYISPIKTMLLWFKDNKGFAAGIAIAGFGMAKVLGGPGFSYFLRNFGIAEMFIFHGLLYLLIMILAVIYIRKPKEEVINKESINLNPILWVKEIIDVFKLKDFWKYWLVFFLNITAGLSIISNEAVFFKYSGITLFTVGVAVSLCAICNSVGRLGIAWISDYIKRRDYLLGIIMVISSLCCLIGFTTPGAVTWTVLVCNAGYGAMFSVIPVILSDRYGIDKLSKIHGVILSSWALAGLIGNQVARIALIFPNSYSPRVIIMCVIAIYLFGTYICSRIYSKKN